MNIIEINNGEAGNPEYRMAGPISLSIADGEQIAVIGDNAAGKTRLIETLCGNYPVRNVALKYDFTPSVLRLVSENIKYLTFRDTYEGADSNYYLQKRWNQIDIDEETPTVGVLLERAFESADESAARFLDPEARLRVRSERTALRERLYSMFGLSSLLDKYIITLSSGELRKFQLTRTLLAMPRVLILDNPFIGLDAPTRDQLSGLLADVAGSLRILLILVLSDSDSLPPFITHVIPVEGLRVCDKVPADQYLRRPSTVAPGLPEESRKAILDLPAKDVTAIPFYPQQPGSEIVKCNSVTIQYGSRTILKDLDWTVREGERWALSGENGAGKSTLLSLVCADNPQSYACDIELFGHKRGSGESIWEIKRHIGYVSPEMHRAYLKNIPVLDIVASGLFDTVGLFMHPSEEQYELCRKWMRIFGIEHLCDKSYLKISSGEQRLALLARAFVKDPELLVLDEPMHGLDPVNCRMAKDVIDTFVRRLHKTLIIVTHYQSKLPSCIDHNLYLKRNK